MWQSVKKIIKYFRKNNNESLRDTIEELIDDDADTSNSDIEADERLLLGNVLSLRDLEVHDIMVPRADIVAMSINASPEDIMEKMVSHHFTNIPIYLGALDQITGHINVKDVLRWLINRGDKPDFRSLVQEVLFISPTMRTLDLLFQMRQTGIKLSIVVDEYGGVDGLVSFNDLVEEIVGDIQDAQETTNLDRIELRADHSIVVDSRVTLDDLKPYLTDQLVLDSIAKDVDTIGGLVVYIAGHVPVRGEIIKNMNNLEFEILHADPRRIHRLCIRDSRKKG